MKHNAKVRTFSRLRRTKKEMRRKQKWEVVNGRKDGGMNRTRRQKMEEQGEQTENVGEDGTAG